MSLRRTLGLGLGGALLVAAIAIGETESLSDRAARLAELPASDKADLQQKQERFRRLAEEEQDRLRRLEQDLASDPQGEQLRDIMLRYNEWLRALNSTQRTELLNLPMEQRIERIKVLLEELERQQFQDLLAIPLPPDDQRVLMSWVNELLRGHEQLLLEKLPPLDRQRLRQVEDPNRRLMMLITAFRWRTGSTTRLFELIQPTEEQIAELRDRLSPQSQLALNSARDTAERKLVLQGWVRAAIESRMGPPVDVEELQRFWKEHVTAEQREYLESLPRDRMKLELQRLYQKHRFNGKLRPGPPPFGNPAARRADAVTGPTANQ